MRESDMEDLLPEPTDQPTPVVKTNKTQTPKVGDKLADARENVAREHIHRGGDRGSSRAWACVG